MERIIVYFDDAQHALQQLVPMRSAAGAGATHWVLVACPPRLRRRIGKWVSHSARELWREKWAGQAFAQVAPALRRGSDEVTPVVAHGPLAALTRELVTRHGTARVLDARRPRFGHDLPPVTEDQPDAQDGRWQVPGAVIGMGAALLLAAE